MIEADSIYHTIQRATAADDIAVGTIEWLLDPKTDTVRMFMVKGHVCPNVVRVEYMDKTPAWFRLPDFQRAVEAA